MMRIRGRPITGFFIFAAALFLGGCGNEVSNQPVAATGGSLCLANYQRCVNPIFNAVIQGRTGPVTCSAGGCHSQATGSGGSFKIDPSAQPDTAEMMSNYFSAESLADLDNPPDSLLLQKPTAGRSAAIGGHAGGDIFPSTADACHVAIQTWISNRVDDPNSASCGSCEAPDVSTCGY